MTRLVKKKKVEGKPYLFRKTYKVKNGYVTIRQYRQIDLLRLSDSFAKNRKFDKWAEVFHPSLKGKVNNKPYKISYERYSWKLANEITQKFVEIMHKELIEKNVEYSFNSPKKEENRFSIRMGYIEKPKYEYYNKKSIFVYPFSGAFYLIRLRYPKAWPSSFIIRLARFGKAYRKEVFMQLIRGKRYYNSVKEKILSEL